LVRAIWKGVLRVGKHDVGVKFYSAIQDRTTHFHLLHRKDDAPVVQHIVRKDTGEDVPRGDVRKAFAIGKGTAVILQPEELEKLVPPESRDIEISRFIPAVALNDQWFDRPYLLGPDEGPDDYFALATALERRQVVGIARWVMRKKRYLGALGVYQGYLAMTTLRRAEQVLSFTGIEPARTVAPHASELKLAQQFVESISDAFDSEQWQNDYRERLRRLIDAKARGEKLERKAPRKRARQANLADSLRASIAAAREKKVA